MRPYLSSVGALLQVKNYAAFHIAPTSCTKG